MALFRRNYTTKSQILGTTALRVPCGQACLWRPISEQGEQYGADVAAGLWSELLGGHPEPGTHAAFSSWWEAHAVLLVSLLTKQWLGQMSLVCSVCFTQKKLSSPLFFLPLLSSLTEPPLHHPLVTSLLSELTPTANQDGQWIVLGKE